jgi:hypothetical protein
MDRAFSPSLLFRTVSWGVAPGWDRIRRRRGREECRRWRGRGGMSRWRGRGGMFRWCGRRWAVSLFSKRKRGQRCPRFGLFERVICVYFIWHWQSVMLTTALSVMPPASMWAMMATASKRPMRSPVTMGLFICEEFEEAWLEVGGEMVSGGGEWLRGGAGTGCPSYWGFS